MRDVILAEDDTPEDDPTEVGTQVARLRGGLLRLTGLTGLTGLAEPHRARRRDSAVGVRSVACGRILPAGRPAGR